jgi:hypothetical protein
MGQPAGVPQLSRPTSQAPSRKLPQYTAQPPHTQLFQAEPSLGQLAPRKLPTLQPSLVPGSQYTGSAATLLPPVCLRVSHFTDNQPDPTNYGRPEFAPSILQSGVSLETQ